MSEAKRSYRPIVDLERHNGEQHGEMMGARLI